MPDAAIGFDIEASTQRFAPKSPYDCILFATPYLFCLELKSTATKSLSFSGSSPNIKENQIKELTVANQYENVIAGFVMNFRNSQNVTYFLHINDFNRFKAETTKKSININDVVAYGGIPISNKQLKVHYRYDVDEFISIIFSRGY